MYTTTGRIVFVVCLALTGLNSALARVSYKSDPAYNPPVSVVVPERGCDAEAGANSNTAGARAAAAKILSLNPKKLDAYGYQIGKPLLAKDYGELTNLYAASLPARSLVSDIDPVFYKDDYGNIKFQGESRIAVAVI